MAKVLVVEDHKEEAGTLAKWLESKGHAVDVVHSGEDAQHLLTSYGYELLILDWTLPGISGLDVCIEYRRKGGKAVVLMLTGRGDIPSKAEGLNSGADDYLGKPYDLRELSARVNALLRRPADTIIEKLQASGVVLDIGTRTATFGGNAVELSSREYALLEYLLRHQNRVYSARALLDYVWPVESAMSEDTVRSVMRNLRKKLDAGGREIIKTVHGSGYLIASDDSQ